MKFRNLMHPCTLLALFGCASNPNVCEDILEIKEQQAQCQLLEKQISAAKKSTLLRSELERRYQNDCVDTRFYRDDHQDAICKNKKQMKDIK